MGVYERIERAIKVKGLSIYKVCKDTGLTKQSFNYWKNGVNTPKADKVKIIADYLGVSASYLMYGDETEEKEPLNQIPVLGIVPCGVPIEAIEDIKEYIDVLPGMAKNHFGLYAQGDSMFPYICNGDVLVVKKTPTVKSGKIAIVKVNGDEATCKKIIYDDTGLTLVPLNPQYEPIHYNAKQIEEKPVTIIGEVVESRRRFK